MIEFIEFNENKTGIKFLSKFDNDKNSNTVCFGWVYRT